MQQTITNAHFPDRERKRYINNFRCQSPIFSIATVVNAALVASEQWDPFLGSMWTQSAWHTARYNHATRAQLTDETLNRPFADGCFQWLAIGHYTEGERKGQRCVCKWFKERGDLENQLFETDIEASKAAIRIISKWNAECKLNVIVRMNLQEVWTLRRNDLFGKLTARKVLQEPFIENYQKFHSSTGWADT